jgi:hypothetical protein
MSSANSSEQQFESLLTKSDLSEVAIDYAEIFIDRTLAEGILKEIPVIKTVLATMDFANSFGRYLFTKKIYQFLFELTSISEDKRAQKINEINESKQYQSKIGEIIFEQLEKVESDYKPKMLGRLFKAFIEEKISFSEYLRLASAIQFCFVLDLIEFKRYKIGQNIGYISDQIFVAGFVTMKITDNVWDDKSNFERERIFTLTRLGKLYIDYS